MNWLPTISDIRFYQETGWFVSPEILPHHVLDAAEEGIHNYYNGQNDNEISELARKFDWKSEHGNILRLNNYISLQVASVQKLVNLPTIGRTAGLLARTQAIRLYKDSSILKPPSLDSVHTKVGWHTDRSYWNMCTSDHMLTAWIPFQDSNVDNGSLCVIDGSHRWPLRHDMRTFNDQETEGLIENFIGEYGPTKKRVLEVKRGQVSFHDCRLLHGSMENISDSDRLVLAIHLQPDDNRHRIFSEGSNAPLVHLNDLLCRKLPNGMPDYTDPEIFPELWHQKK